jgi:3-deoxy-D-manno-octulosonate 8-phosphate phosphatase (KDO 8-P phosphatase)
MKNIKMFIMDVDGTLTDGKIYMGNEGEPFKTFSIKDGYAVKNILIPSGITPIIITGRSSNIVLHRGKEMGVKTIYQGVEDKAQKLVEIMDQKEMKDVAYIGDDENDLACMKIVKENGGLVGCPADACEKVKNISDYVCKNTGGNGAVREFAEWLV